MKRIKSILWLIFAEFCCHLVVSYSFSAMVDQITSLPGARKLYSNQFSGFLNITANKFLHYMYFESENNPQEDDLIFWTNGGPGCSGLLGLFTEFGPWRPLSNGTLLPNPYSWTKVASLVFLEQPVGVGFSYCTDESQVMAYNDYRAASDNLLAIKTFFQKFPEQSKNGFYLASESYGGHYVPQWTLQVLGDKSLRARFKGYLVGNPFTSYASGSTAMSNVLWGLQLVPQPLWDEMVANGCDDLDRNAYYLFESAPQCFDLTDQLFTLVELLNPYALDFPVCDTGMGYDHSARREKMRGMKMKHSPQGRQLFKWYDRLKDRLPAADLRLARSSAVNLEGVAKMNPVPRLQRRPFKRRRLYSSVAAAGANFTYDPCTQDYTVAYLNREDVQQALHVLQPDPANGNQLGYREWDFCDDTVFDRWALSDYLADTTTHYSTIFNHRHKRRDFKMLVYSGDSDGVCATVGTQNWIYSIEGAQPVSLYQPWYYEDPEYGRQQGGFLTQFNGSLSFVTVHYAGHEVPAYQPEPALEMLRKYLNGSLFANYTTSNEDILVADDDDEAVKEEGGSGGTKSEDGLDEAYTTMAVMLAIIAVLGVIFGVVSYWLRKKPAAAPATELEMS